MGEGQRAFKGVWICAAIWTHPDLSWIEKALLAEIDSLVSEGAPCYASNEHLAERMGVSVSRVNDMLARLQSTGFIIRVQYDGRATHRVVNPEYSSNPETAREWIRESARAKKESSRKRETRVPENRNSGFLKTGKQTSEKQEDRVPENRDAYIERVPKENTNREREETTTTRTSYEFNKQKGEQQSTQASSRCASLSVLSGGSQEPAAEASDEVGTAKARSDALAGALAKEFRLTGKQRQIVTEYCESHGQEYVLGKAEIVRSAPRKNAAGALLAALREDWQPPLETGERVDKAARLAASRAMAERMGWEW